jgi:hypothetical protein
MKKIISMSFVMMLLCGSAFAAFVNLTKTGTTWVWRVPCEESGIFLLLEAGDALLLEDSTFLSVQEGVNDALYNALIGQGWTETTDGANVPQALEGTAYALVYEQALIEDDSFFVTEDSNNIKLEN